ncbi:SCO family protein [Confluentibacter sediminis]|uniref:SCO family protein n=1 Tax=Confluentibacter sediminis TaxID=2219045 RepID=UPI001F18B422|nr:SCO family protein [Confluentibacter sediminis]
MKRMVWFLFLIIAFGCQEKQLPILGHPEIKDNKTIYPKIKEFSFIDQDSTVITNSTFNNKIYIADFIFLSCPTVCPKMHTQLKSVYDIYKDNPSVSFLSHTIDPERDTVEQLKNFTELHGIDKNWHFVTGNRDSIMNIATESYFTTAYPDSKEPGGLVHGGGFLLVDKNRHIRGVYDGTDPVDTARLSDDIKVLLKE